VKLSKGKNFGFNELKCRNLSTPEKCVWLSTIRIRIKRIQLGKQSKRGKLAASSERTGQKQMPQNASHHTHTHTHALACSLLFSLITLSPSLVSLLVFLQRKLKTFPTLSFFLLRTGNQA